MIDLMNPGICQTCLHVAIVRSDRGATFHRCTLSDHDPQFAKYPRLPVTICKGWTENCERAAEVNEAAGDFR